MAKFDLTSGIKQRRVTWSAGVYVMLTEAGWEWDTEGKDAPSAFDLLCTDWERVYLIYTSIHTLDSLEDAIAGTRKGESWEHPDSGKMEIVDWCITVVSDTRRLKPAGQPLSGWRRVGVESKSRVAVGGKGDMG